MPILHLYMYHRTSIPLTTLSKPNFSPIRANLAQASHHLTTAHRTTPDPGRITRYYHYLNQPTKLAELIVELVEMVELVS